VDYLPGSEAPEDGVYEQLNFGTSTGITERVSVLPGVGGCR
jgi:hypothetical protein